MGEIDRYGEYKKFKRRGFSLGYDGNALTVLFTIIIIFFVLLLTIQVCYNFFQQPEDMYNGEVVDWFSLPGTLTEFSERPWTILTYMFSDTWTMLFRVLGNLLWLWAFGYILQSLAGNDKLIPIFLYCGIIGGISFIASNSIISTLHSVPPVNHYLMGSNPAVMGVAMATTALSPRHRILTHIRKGIPVWVLMAIYLAIDLVGMTSAPATYSISHIAGAATGAAFIYLMRMGYDLSLWMIRLYNWFMNLFNPNKPDPKRKDIREKVFYNVGNRTPYKRNPIVTQQRIDEILDKINSRGYQFLTEEEKAILRKASEEDL